MKKLLVGLSFLSICTLAFAHSVEWYVDGSLYQTTTCEAGDSITPPTAPTKYGYTFDKWESKYKKLEYIESSGTQYIDTGVNFLFGDEFYFDFMKVANVSGNSEQKGYGTGTNAASIIAGGGRISNNKLSLWSAQDGYYNPQLSPSDIMQKRYVENWKISTGKIDSLLTDTDSFDTYSLTIKNQSLNDSYNSGNSVYLFRDHLDLYAFPSATRLYKTWLKRVNGSYAFNLIPAKRTSDNAIGLYDTVTDTFFENAGTGEFIAGPEVGGL